ncbi:MAG: helix-turn-helix transcriptional regulator [Thermomicrobiales bacterium]|nr:helix-turn-helix transcriptional regulator [Thermomicrobiales bacterium]
MTDSENEVLTRKSGYGQFCPVSIAAEVLAEKWTLLVLRELLAGSSRFNDIQRGVPLMSATLLSQRLRTLEHWGLIERIQEPGARGHSYCLTEAGMALGPIIDNIGVWGLKYMRQTTFADQNLDPSLLMWDMRRWIRPESFPCDRAVIMITVIDVQKRMRNYWLVKDTDEAVLDLCLEDPGFDVDLTITSDIETLTRVWMGDMPLDSALRNRTIQCEGSAVLRMSVYDWIGLNPFAHPSSVRPKITPGRVRV